MPRKGKKLRSEFCNMYFFGVFHVALRLMVQTVEPLLCKHSPDLLWVKSRRDFYPLFQRTNVLRVNES